LLLSAVQAGNTDRQWWAPSNNSIAVRCSAANAGKAKVVVCRLVMKISITDFTCQLPSDAALVLRTNDCNVASLFSSICSRCNASYTAMQQVRVRNNSSEIGCEGAKTDIQQSLHFT